MNVLLRTARSGSGSPRRTVGAACLIGLLVLAAGGCESGRGGAPPASRPAHGPHDGLLDRSELQAVVDLQVARDEAGLIARLDDPDPTVRARSAFALGSMPSARAEGPLLDRLDDPAAPVREHAAFALGQGTETEIGNELAAALVGEADRRVRAALVEALGKRGGAEAVAVVAGFRDPRIEPTIALALSRALVRGVDVPAALDRVTQGLTHVDPEVRVASAHYFAREENPLRWTRVRRPVRLALDSYAWDDPSAIPVLEGLARSGDVFSKDRFVRWFRNSPDWRIRIAALSGLDSPSLDADKLLALYDALDDASGHVRLAAARQLAETGPAPSVAERVAEWLRAHPEDWRTAGPLVVYLARLGETDLVFEWLDRWDLAEEGPWRSGVEALAWMGGEEVVERLGRAAGSSAERVAVPALEALIERFELDRDRPRTHEAYREIFTGVVRQGPPAAVGVAAGVLADSLFAVAPAAQALGDAWSRLRTTDETGALVRVVEALASLETPAAEPVLRQGLEHGSVDVRRAAARALTRLTGDPVDVPAGPESEPAARRGPPAVEWARLAELGPHPRLVLETEEGTIVLRLESQAAPLTVQTITDFAREGRYDGVPFHRVVPNFVIQGGDFENMDGTGGPGFRIRSEFTRIPYRRGVLGMARTNRTDTEGSQFFVTHLRTPHLDDRYTAFGWVEEGMAVVDRIRVGHRVLRARVEPDG